MSTSPIPNPKARRADTSSAGGASHRCECSTFNRKARRADTSLASLSSSISGPIYLVISRFISCTGRCGNVIIAAPAFRSFFLDSRLVKQVCRPIRGFHQWRNSYRCLTAPAEGISALRAWVPTQVMSALRARVPAEGTSALRALGSRRRARLEYPRGRVLAGRDHVLTHTSNNFRSMRAGR